MTLYEKHRPRLLSEVVGQAPAVATVRGMLDRGFDGGAFYFIAPPGQGKTSLGRCIARELGVSDMCVTQIVGAQCDADFVKSQMLALNESSLFDEGSGWKCVIVDEAHSMSRQAVQLWLGLLEHLPAKRLIVFTSNCDLTCYGEFSGALFSRCHVPKLDLDLEAAAVHLSKIASAENLNGQPIDAYRDLLRRCAGNLRACFQRIEAGEMLKCSRAQQSAIVGTPSVSSVPVTPPVHESDCIKAIPASSTGSKQKTVSTSPLESEIAAELDRGKKFYEGSKKWKLHKERLAELEARR